MSDDPLIKALASMRAEIDALHDELAAERKARIRAETQISGRLDDLEDLGGPDHEELWSALRRSGFRIDLLERRLGLPALPRPTAEQIEAALLKIGVKA